MKKLVALVLLCSSCFALAAAQSSDPIKLSGEFQQGGVIIGKAPPKTIVSYKGKEIRVSPQGDFVFGFGRDHADSAELKAVLPDGSVWKRTLKIAGREYRIQRIDGLPPKKVTPSEESLKRIRAEGRLASAARKTDDPRTDFLESFIWPSIGPISGVYGSQRVLNGQPRRPHFGVDVAAPTGTPVVAPAAGIVTMAHPDMYFSGGTLILDHGHGLSSSFLHLSKIHVEVGQRVEQGERIADIGATGRVTGPHMDWRMNWFKERVDPAFLVGPMPKK